LCAFDPSQANPLTYLQSINEQRSHEMRWYEQRRDLKKTQASRTATSAQAALILRSLSNGIGNSTNGTSAANENPANIEAANEKELADFDRKIYDAQVKMEEHISGQLKALGVPFFGTDPKLVVDDGEEKPQMLPGSAAYSPVVTKSELMALRRKMVGHLEDLYKDS
jgi:hypothetical protein